MKKPLCLVLGPALFALALFAIPDAAFAFPARAAVGLVLWMALWWITMPVAVGVTALLPVIVNAVLGLVPMGNLTKCFFSEIVILLLGANLITISWEKTGFDKRIALKALCLIGSSMSRQIAVWFVASALLSVFLPNAVACAVMIPVAISMLKFLNEGDIAKSRVGSIILVAVVWGVGVGGLGSPLSGAMNLIAVDWFELYRGGEYMYLEWMGRLLPVSAILLVLILGYLLLIRPKGVALGGTKEFFRASYSQMAKMNRDETVSLILFAAAALLSFGRSLYADLLPGLKPAYMFLLCGALTFIVPKKGGGAIMTWKEAEKSVIWGLLFLFAGGLALGGLMTDTGAADSLAALVSRLNLTGGFGTVFIFVVFTVLLTEVSSNTAAAAIAVPVVAGIVTNIGLDPTPYIYVTAAAFNCAYVLPTSIRAIPIGYGLRPAYLFKKGLIPSLLSIIAVSVWGYLFVLAY